MSGETQKTHDVSGLRNHSGLYRFRPSLPGAAMMFRLHLENLKNPHSPDQASCALVRIREVFFPKILNILFAQDVFTVLCSCVFLEILLLRGVRDSVSGFSEIHHG
jgi:hypothetical protein